MKKRIIFFDANLSTLPAIRYAKSRGFHVITCDNKADNPGHKESDESLLISTYDTELIDNYIQKNPVDAAVYFTSAHGAHAGCHVIERFNLSGIPESIKNTLSYKNNFRQFLQDNGFSSFPKFVLFNGTEIPRNIDSLSFPVIVKPTDNGGNNGITKVNSMQELQAAIDYAHGFSKSGNIIVEEFIDTDLQINGDCVIENGKVLISFLGKHIYPSNSETLPFSTIFGKEVIPQDIRTGVNNEIEKLISAIGIKSGVLNTEFRISKSGKINFIEVNSRHSGNFIYQLMNEAYNIKMEEIAVKLSLGESLGIENRETNGYFAYALIYSDSSGTFGDVEISKELEKYLIKQLIFKSKGDTVNPFTKLTDRIGIVLLRFPSYDKMQEIISNFRSFYKINFLE